jgi:hypothetical protein
MNSQADYVYLPSTSELAKASVAVFTGEIIRVLETRKMTSSSGTSITFYGLEVEVESVDKGELALHSTQIVELAPISPANLSDFQADLVGRKASLYVNSLSNYGAGFTYSKISDSAPNWSIATPEGLAVEVPEESRIVWPLLGSVAKGTIEETTDPGTLVPKP